MRTESKPVSGDLTVDDEFALTGVASGSVTVKDGGRFELKGVVSRGLVVEPGGAATVWGVVSGDAENRGGDLIVFGVIAGRLRAESGRTRVHKDAKVAGGISGRVVTFTD